MIKRETKQSSTIKWLRLQFRRCPKKNKTKKKLIHRFGYCRWKNRKENVHLFLYEGWRSFERDWKSESEIRLFSWREFEPKCSICSSDKTWTVGFFSSSSSVRCGEWSALRFTFWFWFRVESMMTIGGGLLISFVGMRNRSVTLTGAEISLTSDFRSEFGAAKIPAGKASVWRRQERRSCEWRFKRGIDDFDGLESFVVDGKGFFIQAEKKLFFSQRFWKNSNSQTKCNSIVLLRRALPSLKFRVVFDVVREFHCWSVQDAVRSRNTETSLPLRSSPNLRLLLCETESFQGNLKFVLLSLERKWNLHSESLKVLPRENFDHFSWK